MSNNNNNTQVVELPLNKITPSFGNDRTIFNADEIEKLAASINANGLIQPITVRPLPGGNYQLIAGERRYRAHVHLGREFIRAIVAPMDDEAAAGAMLVENTGRVDLDPIDEARAYDRRREMGWDDAKIADCAGVSIQIVRNRIKLLTLNSEIQHLVRTGNLQVGYANVMADAELDKNRQRIALGRLIQNPAPTVTWFRRECAELAAAQAQTAMFDDSFSFEGLTGQNVNVETVKLPADPKTDSAPMIGKTYYEMMQNRITFWREAADQWDRYGKTANRDRCLAAAKECESLLAVMPADHNFRGKRVKRGNKVLVVYVATAEPVAPVIEIAEPAIEDAPGAIDTPAIIEPAIEAAQVVTTKKQFLAARGIDTVYTEPANHRMPGASDGQRNRQMKRFLENVTINEAKKSEAVKEFDGLIATGAIREPSYIEKLIEKAQGHSDNPSVQAARRLLVKKGIELPPTIEAAPVVIDTPAIIEPAMQSIEEILADTPIPAAPTAIGDTLDLEPFGALPAGLDYFCDKQLNRHLAEIQHAENAIRAAIKANRYRIDTAQLALLNARASDARRDLMIHLVKNSKVA